MKRRPLSVLVLALCCVAVPVRTTGQDALNFEVLSFRVPGIVMLPGAADIDGDGQADLLLFSRPSKESREKFCSVYLQKNGKLGARPDFEIQLGESVSGIQVGDLDDDAREELIGFDGAGVEVFRLTDSNQVVANRVLSYPTILPPTSRYLAPVNWVADLTADGKKDLLLPVAEGMRLFEQRGKREFVEARSFAFPMNGSFRLQGDEHYISYRIPTIALSDFDNDGRADLGAFDLERMDYFLSNGGDSIGRHVSSPLLRKFTKDFIGASNFMDLNADAIPDAVLVLMSQKKNLESEVQIYFGTSAFTYGDTPDHVYSADSSLIFPLFLDATGDGKMEMLLQDIDVGIGFFINYFLRNRIRVDTALRIIGADGKYEKTPSVTRAIYIQASEEGAEPARAAGDFNGDGLDDLVVGTSQNRLSFILGNKNDILPREPAVEFDVPAYGAMALLELNDDARADFVITYSDDDKENLAVVFLSR